MKYYSSEKRKEILEACKTDSIRSVSEARGVPYTTIYGWLYEEKHGITIWEESKKNKATKAIIAPIINTPPPQNMELTLPQFIGMLHKLITEYAATQTELLLLKKQVNEWQNIAGKLNTEMMNRR